MLRKYFVVDISRVAGRGCVQSFACFGVGTFPTKILTTLMPKSLFRFGGDVFGGGAVRVVRNVVPKGRTVPVKPSVQLLPSESETLVAVLRPPTARNAEDALSEHLQFSPVSYIIVVGTVGQTPRQALRPLRAQLLRNVLKSWSVFMHMKIHAFHICSYIDSCKHRGFPYLPFHVYIIDVFIDEGACLEPRQQVCKRAHMQFS